MGLIHISLPGGCWAEHLKAAKNRWGHAKISIHCVFEWVGIKKLSGWKKRSRTQSKIIRKANQKKWSLSESLLIKTLTKIMCISLLWWCNLMFILLLLCTVYSNDLRTSRAVAAGVRLLGPACLLLLQYGCHLPHHWCSDWDPSEYQPALCWCKAIR